MRRPRVCQQDTHSFGDPTIPSFYTYIDYAYETLYLSMYHLDHHSTDWSAIINECLSSLSVQPASQKLQRLGFNGNELYYDHLESIASYAIEMGNLSSISFAYQDDCCHDSYFDSTSPSLQHGVSDVKKNPVVLLKPKDRHRRAISFKQLEIPNKPRPRRQCLTEGGDMTPAWHRDIHWVADRLRRILKYVAEEMMEDPRITYSPRTDWDGLEIVPLEVVREP